MNPELNSAMNSEFDEILITAYLDNEVTDQERALVEEQLRSSESSRKLLEELRSVRNMVVQLHLEQPSRSFQHGPWNDTKELVASSNVVLNDIRSGWNVSYQRLASIAALIAVAACVSVLVFGPNRSSMSLTENSIPTGEPASPVRESLDDNSIDSFNVKPAPPIVASDNAPPAAKSRTEVIEPNNLAENELLGRAAISEGAAMSVGRQKGGAGRESKEFESSAGVPGAGGPGSDGPGARGSGGLGDSRGFGNAVPAKPLAKQKADTTDAKRAEPAPAASKMMQESNAQPTENGIAHAPVVALQSVPAELDFLKSLTQKQADGESDWLPSKISPSQARYAYRFRSAKPDENKKSLDETSSGEKQTASNAPLLLSLGSSAKKSEEVSNPLIVELQVPVEEWESGAKRLRQMGIEVPLELPEAEYLDFTAIQIQKDTSGLADTPRDFSFIPFDADAKPSKTKPVLGWEFRRLDLNRNQLESKLDSDKVNASSRSEPKQIESIDPIRIRVRVIKKE